MIDQYRLLMLLQGGGFTVSLTPGVVVAFAALMLTLLTQIVLLARWTATIQEQGKQRDARLATHDNAILSLNDARSEMGNRVIVLEAHAENTDKELDRWREEERDLKSAVAELLRQRGVA